MATWPEGQTAILRTEYSIFKEDSFKILDQASAPVASTLSTTPSKSFSADWPKTTPSNERLPVKKAVMKTFPAESTAGRDIPILLSPSSGKVRISLLQRCSPEGPSRATTASVTGPP